MIQTLKPYTNTAKTAEIMARYRPIAPKPEVDLPVTTNGENTSMPQNIRKSAYLRTVWPNLQARPTRTRKRGRTSFAPPPAAVKRQRTSTCLQGLYLPYQITLSPTKNLSLNGFSHSPNGFSGLAPIPVPNLAMLDGGYGSSCTTMPANYVTLRPLLPCVSPIPIVSQEEAAPIEPNCIEFCGLNKGIDLNIAAEVPEEHDFLQQLQGRPTLITAPNIIAPQPVRPVGSSICVGRISEDPGVRITNMQGLKKAEEVEEEVESQAMPIIVSDSYNKVRLANSAYKEMVGQPECSWLDTTRSSGGACKRICGEVMIRFSDSTVVPISSNGFSCWVKIEWGSNGMKNSINVFCDAIRLACESKDYLFAWRFHTRDEASESANSNFLSACFPNMQ